MIQELYIQQFTWQNALMTVRKKRLLRRMLLIIEQALAWACGAGLTGLGEHCQYLLLQAAFLPDLAGRDPPARHFQSCVFALASRTHVC
jgi:hypothetical protein